MQKKFWVYQFRENKYPWAICAIVSFPRGNEAKKKVAFDIYSELISNDAHVVHIEAQRYENPQLPSNVLTDAIRSFDGIHERDYLQIFDFVDSVLAKEQ